jgi:hypothetical protein
MSTQQTKLENIAINKRDSLELKNRYQDISGHIYNENHPDALSNGDVEGKGNGNSMGYAIADPDSFNIAPDGTRMQKINYSTIITRENGSSTIGGEYDRNGNPRIKKSGRNALIGINKFSQNNEYGENSVDTIENISLGQYNNV